MKTPLSRRSALGKLAGGAAALAAAATVPVARAAENATPGVLRGRIQQSVCRWCYNQIPFDALCEAIKGMGLHAVDLLALDELAAVQKHDLICPMVHGIPGGIPRGFNRLEHHDEMIRWLETAIPQVAKAGFPNVICFSGNRAGMDDEKGLENCAVGLKRIVATAEKYQVNVVMELLNSKVNHHDYMCDHSAWGVELCKRVGSERFKLLYDIYHMQIMEGDIIHTIREIHPYIAHFHTGGVPGRHEIDDTQELYYPAVMRAIVATGYKGYVGQEFIPQGDALASLRRCVGICDV